MRTRTLGRTGLVVSEQGLGCMGMTFAYGPADEPEAVATLQRALELGITFFDTAEVYGPWTNEQLVGRVLRPVRDRVVIATKFGFRIHPGMPPAGFDSSPANVRRVCEASLQRLGTDYIDLLYQHRVDPEVPIEETVGAMAELVREGKVRFLGLSEAGVQTIRRAHATHPITALQSEYSLWTRDPEDGALATCRELGIGFVAYSPLGRGFLTGAIASHEQLDEKDWRRMNPRFGAANFERNRAVIEPLLAMAAARGCTPAQLALAWVLARGRDIVPIPGTKRRRWLEENAGAAQVVLSAADISALEATIPRGSAVGERYPEAAMKALGR
jgi:aryl-alcohol dehydrogenase-like predicted oxidoreductase